MSATVKAVTWAWPKMDAIAEIKRSGVVNFEVHQLHWMPAADVYEIRDFCKKYPLEK